ncbi:hypothetical protein AWRI1631_152160, partial [Saccharomyces cerevisiae AWRI1631]
LKVVPKKRTREEVEKSKRQKEKQEKQEKLKMQTLS